MIQIGKQGAAFLPVACRIETLVRASTTTDKIENISIFEDKQAPLGLGRLSSLPVDVVHGAWAKLLRSYVCSDTVTFALLLSSHDEGARGMRNMRKLSTAVDDARLCQYHDVSERKWGEWLPDAYQDSVGEGIEELQINTAVHFWVAEEDFSPREPEECTGGGLAQWVSLCSPNARKFSLPFKTPMESEEFDGYCNLHAQFPLEREEVRLRCELMEFCTVQKCGRGDVFATRDLGDSRERYLAGLEFVACWFWFIMYDGGWKVIECAGKWHVLVGRQLLI